MPQQTLSKLKLGKKIQKLNLKISKINNLNIKNSLGQLIQDKMMSLLRSQGKTIILDDDHLLAIKRSILFAQYLHTHQDKNLENSLTNMIAFITDNKYQEALDLYDASFDKDNDLEQAKTYFQDNPKENFYGGDEGAMHHSYVKTEHHEVIRREEELGAGGFGRTKGTDRSTALKRQTLIPEQSLSHLKNLNQEGHVNLDLGVAVDAPITRYKNDKPYKVYINMNNLGEDLFTHLQKNSLTADAQLDLAIQALLTVHALHEGKLSKSGTPYAHLDIKPENFMIDSKGNLTLIDFGFSTHEHLGPYPHVPNRGTRGYCEHVETPNYFFDDKFATLRTIFYPPDGDDSILSKDTFQQLPPLLKKFLSTTNIDSMIKNDDIQTLPFIASALILYQYYPDKFTAEGLFHLGSDYNQQNTLIHQYSQLIKTETSSPINIKQQLEELKNETSTDALKKTPKLQ